MTEEQDTGDEPEPTVPSPSSRRLKPPAPPRPSRGGGEDAAPEERTAPFPYAEKFEDWVADETAAPEGQPESR